MLQSINPANDEVIREYEEGTEQEIESVLQKSQTAFEQWRETDFSHRAPLMKKAAEVLRDHRQIPAIPGKVRVALKAARIPRMKIMFSSKAKSAIPPPVR